MKKYKFRLLLILLFPIAIFINYLCSLNPQLTEDIFSLKINKFTIILLSNLTNFIPFSLYELFIISLILLMLIYLFRTVAKIVKDKGNLGKILLNFSINTVACISIFYFIYTTIWTLNYNRVPIDVTLNMERSEYTKDDLAHLYKYLIDNVNTLRAEMNTNNDGIATVDGGYKSVLERAILGYDAISSSIPSLSGDYGSPKPLLFSSFFNYTGITGIYFPFSGQPSVAVKIPEFSIPATALHEMAHQRGYASEEECNFIAFLTSINHPDIDFKYSGYMLALSYTSNALYDEDLELLKSLNATISPEVKKDLNYEYDFWQSHKGKIDKIASKINDTYLKSNGVADGEKSYGRVVDLLISYYKNKL